MKKIIYTGIFTLLFLQFQICTFAQNVGINIPAPIGKLHVKGSENTSQLIIDADTIQSNTSPFIKLRKSDGTDLMWIHSDHPFNAFIGINAGSANNAISGGLNNTFIGNNTGYFNTTGGQNIAIGNQSLYTQSYSSPPAAPTNNVAIGYKSLYFNQPNTTWNGAKNTAIGNFSLYTNSTGFLNTANGHEALYKNTTGVYNTSIGAESMYSNTTGYLNTASGYRALYFNTAGAYNTAIGYRALYYNMTGENNTAMGYQALFYGKAGSNATAIGYNSMLYANNSTTPFINYNVAIGFEALRGSTDYDNNTGNYNTALGSQSLWGNSTGSFNTAVGDSALFSNRTGFKNTAIGYYADVGFDSLTNATAIGYNAKVAVSNALVLGGTGMNAVKVGIGTNSPQAALDINGDVIFRSADLVVADGITLTLDVNTEKYSYYRLAGPTSQFELSGITAGISGRLLTLLNVSGFPMQLNNADISTAMEKQIITGTNDDLLLENLGMVTLRYDGGVQKWIVNNSNKNATEGIWQSSGSNVFFENNVGIGTDEPDAPLTIQTGLNQAGFTHMTDASTSVLSSSITDIGAAIGTTSEDIFSLNAGGEGKVHVWPDGRVVIGDDADPLNFAGSNPVRTVPIEAKLTIETPINSAGWIHIGGPDSIIVSEGVGGVSAALGTLSNHVFRLNSGGQGKLHIFPDGKVIVGTNSEGAYGKFTVHTPNNSDGLAHISSGGILMKSIVGGVSAGFGTFSNHMMRIFSNSVAVINIDPAGNIGIGTPDPLPGYKLSVNGNIKAKELVIETVGWPDYVFAKDYQSLSLPEVEQFINQHHHLPNIPSAKELEEGGVAVGEMQKKMMEKIEELTLYIIELNKRIEVLEKK